MSLVLIVSIAIRCAAAIGSIYVWRRVRDRRILFLTAMLVLMAVRQILTLSAITRSETGSSLMLGTIDELPGLLVSIMAALSVYYLGRLLDQLRLTQTELEDSRIRLITAHDSAHLGAWEVNVPEQTVTWSPPLFHLFYRDPTLGPPSMNAHLKLVHPEDRESARVSAAQAIATGELTSVDFRSHPDLGPIRHLNAVVHAVRMSDGKTSTISGTTVDISDRVHGGEELRKSHERFNLAANAAAMGVFDWDIQSNRVYYSPMWKQQLGYTDEDISDGYEEWENRIHPEDKPTILKIIQDFMREPNKDFMPSYRLLHKNGQYRWMSTTAELIADHDGTPRRVVGANLDITRIKKAEEERLLLENRVQESQRLESLGVLAGGIAHDFNNILTIILANSEMIRTQAPLDDDLRESAEDVRVAVDRAADLCDQLLAYSGKSQTRMQPCDLSTTVRDIGQMLVLTISSRAIIHYDLDGSLPPVEADATQLQQIVMNLVMNAAESIGEGSGTITLSTGQRECDEAFLDSTLAQDGHAPGTYVYVRVKDSGSGMDEETQKRVFEPFFTTKFTGRGLGMSAVLGIVNNHKGAITVDSAPGNGSTFSVYLPLSAATRGSAPAPSPPDTTINGEGLVLIVDDEEHLRKLSARVIRRMGFDTQLVQDGHEALEFLTSNFHGVACVLLDTTMPGISGEEALASIRKEWPQMPVVMMSGYTQDDAWDRLFENGHTAFLKKPFTPETLRQKIASVIA